jgi:hypothetical protein
MNAQFGIADFSQIADTLQSFSEPMHVDAVEFRFDAETKAAVATFACEHYGNVVVSRTLDDGETEISVNHLKVMAELANEYLLRFDADMAWGAVFGRDNVTAQMPPMEVPEGFTFRFDPSLN